MALAVKRSRVALVWNLGVGLVLLVPSMMAAADGKQGGVAFFPIAVTVVAVALAGLLRTTNGERRRRAAAGHVSTRRSNPA